LFCLSQGLAGHNEVSRVGAYSLHLAHLVELRLRSLLTQDTQELIHKAWRGLDVVAGEQVLEGVLRRGGSLILLRIVSLERVVPAVLNHLLGLLTHAREIELRGTKVLSG
jgi:hypothetical protein